MKWTSIYNKERPSDGSKCVVVTSNNEARLATFANGMFDAPNVEYYLTIPEIPVLNEEQKILEKFWETGRAHEYISYLALEKELDAIMHEAAVVSIMKNENFLNIMKYAPNLYNTLKKLAIMDGVIHGEVEGKNEKR